jgi:hypothetical protein
MSWGQHETSKPSNFGMQPMAFGRG